MIYSVTRLIGHRLAAIDGEIGHLKDFYFDDGKWTVRYAVAETGSWLRSRQVLLSPRSFGEIDKDEKTLHVNLSREQVQNSPPIDTQKPVSRQYEEEYHRYYGWPYYWQGAALWGMSGFPILQERAGPYLGEQARLRRDGKNRGGSLRSVQVVTGYRVKANEDVIGHLSDFLVNGESWEIQSCVVAMGSRSSDKHVLVSPEDIERISWETSTIHLKVASSLILQAPEYNEKSLQESKPERMTIFI